MEIVKFEKEEKYINDFLSLPIKLYSKKDIMQNEEVERNILLEKHILSKYFNVNKILIYNENVVVRKMYTYKLFQ